MSNDGDYATGTNGLFGLLEAAVRERPSAAAVEFGDESYTYGELLEQAMAVGSAARKLGAQPGTRVALLADKSCEAVAALYGVLSTGAAYVPLDPRWPDKRMEAVLRDVRPALVVACSARAGELAAPGIDVPWLDAGRAAGPGLKLSELAEPGAYRPSPTKGEDLAYVLYTSGSTGRPKGVAISHRASLAFIEWAAAELDLQPDDRMVNHASFSFDLSVLDLFGAAMAGAAVLPAPKQAVTWPRVATAWLEQVRATVLYTVPWTYVQMLRHGSLGDRDLSRLRLALYAGEPFAPDRLAEVMSVLGHARFYNLYGPTETNVCTFYKLERPPAPGQDQVPIGRPCSGDRVVLVDQDMAPVPPDQEGELLVAGPSLMTCYLNDPEATFRAFVEVELNGRRVRAYRTGDLARLGPDGELYLLGRMDRMVKRRGARIELAELEAAAAQHPGVEEAAAVTEAGEGAASIHVYFTCRPGASVSAQELLGFMSDVLPAYMLPDRVERVDSLPRTFTGKVDRRRFSNDR